MCLHDAFREAYFNEALKVGGLENALLTFLFKNLYHAFFWPNLWSVMIDNKVCLMEWGAMRSLGLYPTKSRWQFDIGVYFVCRFSYCTCCVPLSIFYKNVGQTMS